MFYAHFVLSKRGPLARIWLAAHWDKKLTKAAVFETNIDSSVEAILQPKVKLALRTSGHLLLGVVRIYSRKAKYLLADCNEAFVKIKMAFRPGLVELNEDNREAAIAAITLPENFHDFDTTMAELDAIDVQAQFTVNQSRPEEITLKEDVSNITFIADDGFGDLGFDDPEILRDTSNLEASIFTDADKTLTGLNSKTPAREEKAQDVVDNVFNMDTGVDDDDDANDDFGGGMDDELFGEHSGLFGQEPVTTDVSTADVTSDVTMPEIPVAELTTDLPASPERDAAAMAQSVVNHTAQSTLSADQTTLLNNEQSAFVLEPVDASALPVAERRQHTRRKRKLVVDEQKALPSEAMKVQLSQTKDIVCALDLAPPTKRLMLWKETGGVEKLFALPARPLPSRALSKLHVRNLVTCTRTLDELHEQAAMDRRLALDTSTEQARPSAITEESVLEQSSVAAAVDESVSRSALTADSLLPEPADPADVTLQLEAEPVAMPEISAFSINDTTLVEDVTRSPVEKGTSESKRRRTDSPTGSPAVDREAGGKGAVIDSDNESYGDVGQEELGPGDLEAELDEDAVGQEGQELTEEEREEHRWNQRSQHVLGLMSRRLQARSQLSLRALCSGVTRKQAASRFYTVLLLKKHEVIDVEQTTPFGDTRITKGSRYASTATL